MEPHLDDLTEALQSGTACVMYRAANFVMSFAISVAL
jgi:hypothetical protein